MMPRISCNLFYRSCLYPHESKFNAAIMLTLFIFDFIILYLFIVLSSIHQSFCRFAEMLYPTNEYFSKGLERLYMQPLQF
jgi:hypothetical protein